MSSSSTQDSGDSSEHIPSNANQGCPGVDSDSAGFSESCAGCPNQQICQSKPKGPDPDLPLIAERLSTVKHVILVLSGKGGVGKSTVASQIAFSLASRDLEVGLLDIDVCGPSIPTMMGLSGSSVHETMLGWEPVFVEDNLAVMSIGFLLEKTEDAVIWRGPKKNGMIKSFLRDVYWGDLDYLVVDTPPGTSDEHLSVVQFLKEARDVRAVIVTTPQDVALSDVRREINFCAKIKLPIVGLVENMNGFVCPKCKTMTEIFRPHSGGGKGLADHFSLPFLGSIPIDPNIVQATDSGISFGEAYRNSPASLSLVGIVETMIESYGTKERRRDMDFEES